MNRRHPSRSESEGVPISEDVMTLSFLDVLSCGLGASMCLFLVFSAMPHLGSQSGAGAVHDRPRRAGAEGMLGSVKHSAKYAVVEIEVRIRQASRCLFPEKPWDNSFRSAQALVFPAVVLDNGETRIYTVHFESLDQVNNPIHFRLGPAAGAPAGSTVSVEVSLLVGGSGERLHTVGKPETVKVEKLNVERDLFRVDMNEKEGHRLTWGSDHAR